MKTYLVGGAVRDTLMGKEPKDRDYVVVGAAADQLLAAGWKQVGVDFPVFLHPETGAEYALARTERKSGLGYGGFTVKTNGVTLEQDLARRDLTINSMAIDEETDELIDPHGGMKDLRNNVLRHTSEAFREDPLRVIRLARFFARLTDFTVDLDTIGLCQAMVNTGELEHLSQERHLAELYKLFEQVQGLLLPAYCVERFFIFLSITGVLDQVTFWKNLLGADRPEHRGNFRHNLPTILTQVCKLPPSDAVATFIACARHPSQHNTMFVSKQVHYAYETANKLRAIQVGDAEALYDLLNFTNSINAETTQRSRDLFHIHHVLSYHEQVIAPYQVFLAIKAAAAVKAMQFQDVFGKDLGAAIREARITAIKQELNW